MQWLILADESVPGPTVHYLRQLGWDVNYVAHTASGIDDEQVLAMAVELERLLVTCDRDFGKLIFKDLLPTPASVLYFRKFEELEDPGKFTHWLLTASGEQVEGFHITFDGAIHRSKAFPLQFF